MSKCVSRAQLNDSWGERRTDPAKIRGADTGQSAAANRVELRVIECVKKLRTKLQRMLLPNTHPLKGIEVPVGVPRPEEHVSSKGAKPAGAERGTISPANAAEIRIPGSCRAPPARAVKV